MSKKSSKSKKTSTKPHLLVVEARFYDDISDALLEGATNRLLKEGATFDVVTVPGALEVPTTIAMALKGSKHYDGFVALGCVIRGETYHFDIVANESCRALTDIAVRKRIAVGNGILTVENEKQALQRANPEEKDKGGFAADAALQMIAMKKRLEA